MRAFWEVLSGTQENVKNIKEEIGEMNDRLISVELEQKETNKRLDYIEVSLKDIKKEIVSIKNEIKDLKTSISQKADLKRLETLELKVALIEKHFKLTA